MTNAKVVKLPDRGTGVRRSWPDFQLDISTVITKEGVFISIGLTYKGEKCEHMIPIQKFVKMLGLPDMVEFDKRFRNTNSELKNKKKKRGAHDQVKSRVSPTGDEAS